MNEGADCPKKGGILFNLEDMVGFSLVILPLLIKQSLLLNRIRSIFESVRYPYQNRRRKHEGSANHPVR